MLCHSHLKLFSSFKLLSSHSFSYSYSIISSFSTQKIKLNKEIQSKNLNSNLSIINQNKQRNSKKISFKRDLRQPIEAPEVFPEELEEWAEKINTELTPEQKERVEKIKRKIRGSKTNEKCLIFISFFIFISLF